jgi:hypothetical protein
MVESWMRETDLDPIKAIIRVSAGGSGTSARGHTEACRPGAAGLWQISLAQPNGECSLQFCCISSKQKSSGKLTVDFRRAVAGSRQPGATPANRASLSHDFKMRDDPKFAAYCASFMPRLQK